MKELPKVYFERLLESSPDIVIAVDRKGTVIFYNDGAEATLGYNAEEILGTHVSRIYPSEEEARRVMAAMRNHGSGDPEFVKNFETEFVNKDGKQVPVAISGSIIVDGKGREQGSVGFAKDIQALRQHEQLVTLGELAVGLAHEINNPLEVLVNHVEMLERYLRQKASADEYEREHDRVDAIKRELRKIQSIVERVGEMADEGDYGRREYLPGRMMTDLGLQEPLTETPALPAPVQAQVSGITVLVVDDDPDIRSSMAGILGSEGCKVIATASGLEALRYVEKQSVDLVLTDVVMPDMDGYELFRELRSRHHGLPVVLMTAYYYDKDHVIKRTKAEGLEDVIYKKPIDPARLLELVESRAGG